MVDSKPECGWLTSDKTIKATVAVYTYRVEITAFFGEILAAGRAAKKMDGEAYLGVYEVSRDVNACTNHFYYKCPSTMVSNWAIFFVYLSEEVSPKKIYFYHGLAAASHTSTGTEEPYYDPYFWVSGFQFPYDPTVKLSIMVSEGDPAIQLKNDKDNPTDPIKHAENIYIMGPEANDPYSLHDICNEAKPETAGYYAYTEIYNSNSSVIDFLGENITCRTGGKGTGIYYGVDVDTFLLSGEKDAALKEHLIFGQESLGVEMSVNQDMIFTNFIALSVDTKSADWNIPGREKDLCTCSPVKDRVCIDRPFYYTIQIDNIGQNAAKNVTFKDELPATVKYYSGTTQIFKNGKWEKVEDADGGKFPYTTEKLVAAEVKPDDEPIWIRFKVGPTGETFPKAEVIDNIGYINSENQAKLYGTNSGKKLTIRMDLSCPSTNECKEPDLANCGPQDGEVTDDEPTDNDSISGELTKDIQLIVKKGSNSPVDTIIESPAKDLVISQIAVSAKDVAANKDKYYKFSDLKIQYRNINSDNSLSVSNYRLISDANGNGKVDAGENVLATEKLADAGSFVSFVLEGMPKFKISESPNNFIIVADIAYAGKVEKIVSFDTRLVNAANIVFKDSGTPVVTLDPTSGIDFATFKLEKDNVFIFTNGVNIESKAGKEAAASTLMPVMHIRVKDKTGKTGQAINSISVNILDDETKTYFGDGVISVGLYKSNESGEVLDVITEGVVASNQKADFTGLNEKIAPNTNTYFIVQAKLLLSSTQTAQFAINEGDVILAVSTNIEGLPVESNIYGPGEGVSASSTSGCGCSVVSSSNQNDIAGIILLAIIAVFAFFRLGFGRAEK